MYDIARIDFHKKSPLLNDSLQCIMNSAISFTTFAVRVSHDKYEKMAPACACSPVAFRLLF